MKSKVVVFLTVNVGLFFLLATLAGIGSKGPGHPVFLFALLAWFILAGILQFRILKCPHCGKASFIRPGGWASPIVGEKCHYCHKDY